MWKKLICSLLCISQPLQSYAKAIKQIDIEENSISIIRTAIGYSTVLDFPSKPTSVVLGDQDGFKLEYIGNSLTIKPLVSGAKSNLFVFSDQGRYQFTLVSGAANQVDYLVKLRSKRSQLDSFSDEKKIQKLLNVSKSFKGFTLKVTKAIQVGTNLIFEFEISSRISDYEFSPATLGIKRGSGFETIDNLYLDSLKIGPKLPKVMGQAVLLNTTMRDLKHLSFVFAVPYKNKTNRIEITFSKKQG